MAFDRSNSADLVALQTEVNTDPIGMGYAAVVEQTSLLLKLLNDPDNNVGGESVNTPLDPEVLLQVLKPSDLTAGPTSAGAADWIGYLIAVGDEVDLEQFRAKFRGLFAQNSDTVTALDALQSALSRAEVLFGQDTTLTRDDWFAARDYTP